MSEEINVDEVIRTIQFSEIAQKGYKVISNDEFDRIVNGILNLQQENQQLKINCNIGNENLNFYREEYKKYKSVLDEIREYIDEFIIYVDEDGEVYFKEEFRTEYNDLLQILDKVKE